MPEFSVIIPVYNVEKYLVRCIKSVMNQTYTNFELILVDDGSQDSSGKICDEYAKNNQQIKVIHQNNKGVSSARNIGIKSAIGKYIVFVDSDDMVERDYLSSMAQVDEEVDLVICGIKQVTPSGSVCITTQYERKLLRDTNKEIILEMIQNNANASSVGKRFKKQLIEKRYIYLDEELDLGEDGCFVTEYVCNCRRIQYMDVITYRYYKYEHETLSTIDEQCIKRVAMGNKKMELILANYFPDIIEEEIWKKKKYQLYPHCIFNILRDKKSGMQQYKLLKSIFAIEEFQDFLKNINICMPEDNEIIKTIILAKKPLILIAFGYYLKMKKKN